MNTDAKDAGMITDVVAQGQFVGFAFLHPVYADLRYLVDARQRLSLMRRRAITQVRRLLRTRLVE